MVTATATTTRMLPYHRRGDINYARLDFDPDEPVLKPDAMEQNLQLQAIFGLLAAHFTDFHRRPDVFLDANTIICYDPRNLNVRVSPDVYLAFGVDAAAIRPRKLYLPWEVGKPPDWVLEIASSSTGREDTGRKRHIYARIGVPEYWRFDPTGGRYHGQKLAGERLVNGVYQPIALTTEPDGILKGYSPVLGLSLCWDNSWPRLYDPVTDTYLESWPEVAAARAAAEAERDAAESQAAVEQAGRAVAETRAAGAETRAAEAEARAAEAETRAAAEEAQRRAAESELQRLRAQLRRQAER